MPQFSFLLHASAARSRNAVGFTLIEMLAVVVIISLLAILLVPTVQFALRAAENVTCISNLRTIGAGLHGYMADFRGEYPPNRYNERYTEQTGRRPWPSEVLNGTVPTNVFAYVPFAGRGTANLLTRKDAGPWFCPADVTRPMALSADSYAFAIRLGGNQDDPSWQPWWTKPMAHENSGRLIYLIDHDLLREPRSTAGNFSEKSWPIKSGPKPASGSGDPVVDFRHGNHANALKVDGSVQALTVEDLTGPAGLKFIYPDR